jgi:hypothetical protein
VSDSAGPLKRVRYFAGQLLTAADFEAEQRYFLERHRRHNRLLHGWGVVSGLEVSSDGNRGGSVRVGPGFALDCVGDEIVLCEPRVQALPVEGSVVT